MSFTLCFFSALASFLYQVYKRTKCKNRKEAFEILLNSVNLSGALFAIPLFLLWIFDFKYKNIFFLVQEAWRSSATCLVIFTLFLLFLSPCLLFVLSLARFMVVENPLDSKSKESLFITKCVASCVLVCFLVSCFLTSLTWIMDTQMNSLCHPVLHGSESMKIVPVLVWFISHFQMSVSVLVTAIYIAYFVP